jgi:hypothetical protein
MKEEILIKQLTEYLPQLLKEFVRMSEQKIGYSIAASKIKHTYRDISFKYLNKDIVFSEYDSFLLSYDDDHYIVIEVNDNFEPIFARLNWQDYSIAWFDYQSNVLELGEENKEGDDIIFDFLKNMTNRYSIKETIANF